MSDTSGRGRGEEGLRGISADSDGRPVDDDDNDVWHEPELGRDVDCKRRALSMLLEIL